MVKKILIALIIFSLVVAAFPIASNDLAERNNKKVQLTVDMDEVRRLAVAEGTSVKELLQEFQGMGVSAVAIREANLSRYRLEGKVSFMTGYDLLASYYIHGSLQKDLLGLIERQSIDPYKVYLFSTDRELVQKLENIIQIKLDPPMERFSGEEFDILEMSLATVGKDINDMASLRAGVMPEDLEVARELGLAVVPRPDNKYIQTPEGVEFVLEELLSLPGANIFIFEGEEATGFPNHLSLAAQKIQEHGLPMGVIEYVPRQEGQIAVALESKVPTVLTHSTVLSQDPQAIFNGVRQRRVRLVYLRFSHPITDELFEPERARSLIKGVTEELDRYGYESGVAEPIPSSERGRKFFALILVGVAAAIALLAERLLSLKDRSTAIVFAFSYLVLLVPLATISRDSALQYLAILTGITFPSLAVISQQLRNIPKEIKRPVLLAAKTITLTTLISIAGGTLVLALLSNPFFVGGLSLYRGVKILHTAPLIFIGIWALAAVVYRQERWTLKAVVTTIRKLWKEPVVSGGLVGLLLLLGAAYLYLGRTGHDMGLPVPQLEVQLRLLLDEVLLVRPRFKEFLVGYPLTWTGLYLLYRGHRSALTAGLLTAGAIAQVSLVNTFSHFSSPFVTSLIRTINGFLLGSLIGLLIILALVIAEKIYLHSGLAASLQEKKEQ